MAIAYVNGGNNEVYAAATTIAAAAFNATAGNAIVVLVHNYTSGQTYTVTGIADTAGNTYARCGSTYNPNAGVYLEIWLAQNITGNASNVVTATFSGSATYREIIAAQYSGMALTGAHDTAYAPAGNADATTPYTTTAASTAEDNELIVGLFNEYTGATVTYSSSSPSVYRQSTALLLTLSLADNLAGAAGSYSVSVTGSQSTGHSCYAKAFKAAAGGTAHPYTGSVGVGARTSGAATVRTRGVVRSGGGALAFSAATIKARGKVPSVGGGNAYSSSTVKARGKAPEVGGGYSLGAETIKARGRAPTVGGSMAFAAGSIYSQATLYLYVGGASQAYSAESVKARGKSPSVGGSIIYSAESEYSKFSAAGTDYAYVGQGVLVFANGSEIALGKVYTAGGAFVFSGGSVYVKGTAYSYTGLSTGAIVYRGASVYFYDQSDREEKPRLRAVSHEALPGRPAGQDGFYAEPGQDGFYDEYPVEGFYADIGYRKEFKPIRRATFTKEGVPVTALTTESKPASTSTKEGRPS